MRPVPLVSVCIPCHNAGKYLGAALESVYRQNWPAIEVIVVNDSSTDDSQGVLNHYRDDRLTVIDAQLGSAAKARNLAARASTGEYLKFFDADDLLSPTMVAEQVKLIAGEPDVVASSRWGRFQQNDLATFLESAEPVWRNMPGPDWLIESWRHAKSMTQPGIFLIPKAHWDKAGPWNEELTLIDDFEFFSRIIGSAREVRFCTDATLYYRSNLTGSLSSQRRPDNIESAIKAICWGTDYLLTLREDYVAKLACANLLQSFVYSYYPENSAFLSDLAKRINDLGGSDLPLPGPKRFQQLAKFLGWKMARRIQRAMGR